MVLHPRVNYAMIQSTLSDVEIQNILRRRFVFNTAHIHAMTREELLSRLESSTLPNVILPMYSSKWCDNVFLRCIFLFERNINFFNQRRASYIAAEIDKCRNNITREEIVNLTWRYIDSWGYHMYDDDDDEEEEGVDSGKKYKKEVRIRFWPNGTRSNKNLEDPRPSPASWHIDHRGAIQVKHYPHHSIPRRTEDWGYEFSNGYVTYVSVDDEDDVYRRIIK